MKVFIFVFVLILSANQFAYTQYNKDEIVVEQAFGGNKYSVEGKIMNMKQMKTLMQFDESAYAQLKSGRTHTTAATILGATGGFLIGLNVVLAIANGNNSDSNEVKWGMAIAGGVLVLITIPLSIIGNKRINNAVEIYNASLNSASFHKSRPELRVGFTGTGVGLILNF